MATFDINGNLRGKIDDFSFYVDKNGNQVVRKIVKKRVSKTPKQLASRAKFALVNKKMSPLNNVIKKGFKGDAKVYRKAVSNAYHEAIAGEYPKFIFQYSKVKIADGKLEIPRNISAIVDEDFNRVSFTWSVEPNDTLQGEPNNGHNEKMLKGRADDKINIVCFNENYPNEIKTFSSKRRTDGEAVIFLPDDWTADKTHIWIYLTSWDFMENSESVYQRV